MISSAERPSRSFRYEDSADSSLTDARLRRMVHHDADDGIVTSKIDSKSQTCSHTKFRTEPLRGISEATTRQQARAVYRKAGVAGRNDLAAFFLEDLALPQKGS